MKQEKSSDSSKGRERVSEKSREEQTRIINPIKLGLK